MDSRCGNPGRAARAAVLLSATSLALAVPVLAQTSAPASRRSLPSRAASRSPDPIAAVEADAAAAETALRTGHTAAARRTYARVLANGWLLLGAMADAERDSEAARDAYERAHEAAPTDLRAAQGVAVADLAAGRPGEAVSLLAPFIDSAGCTNETRRLFAQALVADGQVDKAVEMLAAAHRASPADSEITFLLAAGRLRLGDEAAAADLFRAVARAKPSAATWVLIGRTYRDAGAYDRARAALKEALQRDSRAARAHYYLGTTAVLQDGMARLDEAIDEFAAELRVTPGDPLATLRLGMALTEAQRPGEALPYLERAAAASGAPADAFHYLGRCHLALGHATEAVAALRCALELSGGPQADETRLLSIHYQLAMALRATGHDREAAAHFAEAERSSARRADTSRARLARYLSDAQDAGGQPSWTPILDASPWADVPATARSAARTRVRTAVARASYNLGVLDAQANDFRAAASHFEGAASADPVFPGVQYALGVACFNDGRFGCAEAALARAHAGDPQNREAARMLAMSAFALEHFERAAQLLADDPARQSDPALQLTYAVALVKSGHAPEAETVFSRLLAAHESSPELNVVLGLAQAEQGDFDAAAGALHEALAREPRIAHAHGALAVIALKRGELPEAEREARAELQVQPQDVRVRHVLATVLDLQGQGDAALREEAAVIRARPDFADAQYLYGKILLARGQHEEAIDHLEAAVRAAPDAANVRYQLANAYRQIGQESRAAQELEAFRRLKESRRAVAP